jgi:signal transduction histidine kinase
MRSVKGYLIIAFSVLLFNELTAQQYPFVNYTPKDGLVNNRARFTFQDSKGRLYISTFGGLSVYDGSRFINYTTENGLLTSLVNQVIEMGDDSLWIIPNAPIIHCLVNGKMKNFSLSDHSCPVINQLLKCSDSQYYAFADEGLFRLEKDHFVKIPLIDPEGNDAGKVLTQGVEKNGKLFMITDVNYTIFPGKGMLLVYDLQTKKFWYQKNLPEFFFITSSPENEIWISSSKGLKKIDRQDVQKGKIRLVPILSEYNIPENFVPSYIYFDHQQNLWLTNSLGTFECGKDGKVTVFTTFNGLPVNAQSSIYQDRENVMWFTNEQTGLTKLVNRNFEFYPEIKPGFTTTDIYANKNSDSVWLYDAIHNCAFLNIKNTWEKFRNTKTFSAFARIAIGSKKGYLEDQYNIYELKKDPQLHLLKYSLIYQNPDQLYPFGNLALDTEDNFFIANIKLLVTTNNLQLLTDTLDYLADQVAIDNENNIWTVTRLRRLFVYSLVFSNGKYSLQKLHEYYNELPNMSPRSISVDNTGNIWIGTRDHGLFCIFMDGLKIKSWKHLTLKDGLSENFINYLYCNPNNTIWACSPGGLDKITQKKGQYFVENVTRGNNIYQYIRKVQIDKQGIVWVVTGTGVIRILPKYIETGPYRPQVLFTEIVAGNKRVNDSKNKLSLSYHDNDITFYMAAPTFMDETITRFSFLLDGTDNNNWSTPSTQSQINFANLTPGIYTLKVKAQFLNGKYPEQIASFTFEILPPWWETWWFRIGLALLVIFFSIQITREYVQRKLEKQKLMMEKQQAVERERTRIATDMHDDLGAGLTRIKFLSENIADTISLDPGERQELEKLKSSSNELVEKMSEIIWAMNEKNNTLADMVFYLRSYAVDYCFENNLSCEFEVPVSIPSQIISGQMRRNIFLVMKESLHNVVKHAVAKKVSIRITTGKSITLTISDDGKGFSNLHKQPPGNGLLNMQTRAKALNGTIKLENHGGTSVMLDIPL